MRELINSDKFTVGLAVRILLLSKTGEDSSEQQNQNDGDQCGKTNGFAPVDITFVADDPLWSSDPEDKEHDECQDNEAASRSESPMAVMMSETVTDLGTRVGHLRLEKVREISFAAHLLCGLVFFLSRNFSSRTRAG